MLIQFELNTNDREALLRHVREFEPNSGDVREDRRLQDALNELAQALEEGVSHSQKPNSDR
ncbi:hypothetical protein D3C79_736280 [compost metagenome]